LAVLATILAAPSARAESVSIVTLQVESGGHMGTWSTMAEIVGDTFNWQLEGELNVLSSTDGHLMATAQDLTVDLDTDPFVALGFAVTAGAVDTNFSISSVVVGFPLIASPQAFAIASGTLTDLDSSLTGASLTGLFPGAKAYQARYNGGGSIFANLLSPLSAPQDGGDIGMERLPAAGRIPVGVGVFNIESQWNFTLSANDSASGTSRFDVIPEPSSFVLAAVAGIALVWQIRRRRRA
jgi:hypothetical protein